MNMELIMQYIAYALMAVGVLAFAVSVIVQVIKELPGLQKIPTSVVALAVSVILCPLAVIIACQYFKIVIVWYYVFASFIAAFIVYLVATGGWERIKEIWNRTKYMDK
ncbi:MAG: ribonuclease [Lachnospiraceae bacterium]|nr:ribonuclease [Lachnospiraceae bacterium]